MNAPNSVIDASALLAWLTFEPGALVVEKALENVAALSVVNWVEVLTKLADLGQPPEDVFHELKTRGVLGSGVILWPMDEALALQAAKLRGTTRPLGLSLGDRVCIALGQHLRLPIFTADRSWKPLRLGVPVQMIR